MYSDNLNVIGYRNVSPDRRAMGRRIAAGLHFRWRRPFRHAGGRGWQVTVINFNWPATGHVPPLEPDQVHVWSWNLDRQPMPAEWELLSPEETQRARRLAYSQDRDRFVRAHAVMRRLLGSYTQIDAADIVYTKTRYGKPEMFPPGGTPKYKQIRFNLSHSAELGVLAVSEQHELGLDIEAMRPIDTHVAERYFSPLELQTLENLPQEFWLRGFHRCWTSKEALLKGEGLGLRLPLDSFDIEADPRRPPALMAVRPPARLHANWRLLELQPASGVTGTLAIQDGEGAANQCFTFIG